MRVLALTLAFILELIAFAAFACVGFLPNIALFFQIVLSIICFIAILAFWSIFMAPKALYKFSPTPYYIAKSVVYFIAAYDLLNLLSIAYGIVFMVTVVIDEALLYRHNLS